MLVVGLVVFVFFLFLASTIMVDPRDAAFIAEILPNPEVAPVIKIILSLLEPIIFL